MSIQQTIFNTARGDGMPVPLANFITAQARHETADFTSAVFKDCTNAFGYQFAGGPYAASACSRSEGAGYSPFAKYPNIQNSVHELTAWIRRRQKDGKFPADLSTITTAAQYAQLLKNAGYFEASPSVYINGLVKYQTHFTGSGGFLPLIAATAGFWLITRKKRK